jgi:hypothetical protein
MEEGSHPWTEGSAETAVLAPDAPVARDIQEEIENYCRTPRCGTAPLARDWAGRPCIQS